MDRWLGRRRPSFILWLFSYSLAVTFVLLVVIERSPRDHGFVEARGLYASSNLCVTHEVEYAMELFADVLTVNQTLLMRSLSSIVYCFLHAQGFEVNNLTAVQLGTGNKEKNLQFFPLLQKLNHGVYEMKRSHELRWNQDEDFLIKISAQKSLARVREGLTFKVYRERSTLKRNWYALVHMGPSQCGKAFFCTNNLRDFHTLRLEVIHWNSHQLNCAGVTTAKRFSPEKTISVCENTFKVGVNNLHYSLTNFPKLEHFTVLKDGKHSVHHITIAGPRNHESAMYPAIQDHFRMILRIYSLLLLTVHLKHFHVIFYVLPNFHQDIPQVYSGSCYFKLEHLLYHIEEETTHRLFLKCLLHQGFMNERKTDSWMLRYVPEGLFERLVNTYVIHGVQNDYYPDVLLGDSDDLDSLGRYDKYLNEIHLKRPWRKAAGFWEMLARITPSYAELTYEKFVNNSQPVETQREFVEWVTKEAGRLFLDKSQFLEMLYTWTGPRGYPILEAKVLNNRTVCVSQYGGGGSKFASRIVPFILDYNYPFPVDSPIHWVQSNLDNCHSALENLYPYLINAHLTVVGRVLYDKTNWEVWAESLMRKKKMRDSLTTRQKMTLIMDALYFAQQNKLDWTMSIKFLGLVRDETDELAWRSFDKVLEYLESLTRYTATYTMFKKLVADVVKKYYYSKVQPSDVAIKWFCLAGEVDCLRYSENQTQRALIDFQFLPNRTEILCGGMRRLTMESFHQMINSMGKPDWREPIFYIEMMMCAENVRILREIMHHLFFVRGWVFRASLLRKLMLHMIKMGKAGSDAVLEYVDHNPVGLLELLEADGLLEVFGELARYKRDSSWLTRFIKRLRLARTWDEKYMDRMSGMFERMRMNKRWYNVHYESFSKYLVEGYRIYLREFDY